ncbi:PGF-pre-PGF domain-containing protein [Halogeometricum rufum]|nr:PGF-pre-PGF domain-containing protein [Halogeometricum rufum]
MRPNVPAWAVVAMLVASAMVAPVVAGTRPAASGNVDAVDEADSVEQAQAAAPDVVVRPVTLRFPNERSSAERTLTVGNVGDATLTVRSVVVVGPDRSSFDTGFDGPVTLDPGERLNVSVSFAGGDGRPRFATVHVMSDDPDEPQRNVWLTNTRTVADVSPSRVLATKTLVNASVRNAEANTTQSLNLSWPLTRDDRFAIDALSFTPERDGNVTLSVATNESRFADVPAFALADGTESAGYLRVRHSIANENVRNVTVRFRVRRDVLAGNETDPEDVALYRHVNGTWTELPTRVVGAGDTHHFFEARAPGLSDFATGVKQARFRITDAVVTVTRIRTDEGTEVFVRVRNVGGADGTYAVALLLGDEVVDRRELSIAPNGSRQATFERSFGEPGTYEVFVNERFVGTVTVESAATTAAAAAPSETTEAGAADTGESVPGFGFPAAGLAVLAVASLLAARRRG